MSSEEKTTHVVQRYAQPVEVELTKGARGAYRWRIGVKGETALQILREIDEIDRHLSSKYGHPQPNPADPDKPAAAKLEDVFEKQQHRLDNAKKAGEKGVFGGEMPWEK
ncbi:MAG: hypothetical protein QMD10_10170 [Desulfitobacteriaceae bacterium]|nr:hypothetical protein [Desulfitobacteriaceae bacterium]